MAHIYLLKNANANIVGDDFQGLGGGAILQISAANYDGAIITIQARNGNDMNWITLPYKGGLAEFTEDVITGFTYIAVGLDIRATITNAGGSAAGINVRLIQ